MIKNYIQLSKVYKFILIYDQYLATDKFLLLLFNSLNNSHL